MPDELYRFNATLHARSASVTIGPEVLLRGQPLPVLQPSQAELYAPFAVSFEETALALEQHARVFFEPDGSFVWGEGADAERWQIDGHLFDRAGKLLYVHLKGSCPAQVFDALLQAVGWPDFPVMLQLQQEGYVLDEGAFRRFAAGVK